MKAKKIFIMAISFVATLSIAFAPISLGAMDYYITSDRYNANTISTTELVNKFKDFDYSSLGNGLLLNQTIENDPNIWHDNYQALANSDFAKKIKDNITVENFKYYLNKGIEFFNP